MVKTDKSAEKPQFMAPDRATWRSWLEENHQTSTGVWLVTNKKGSGAAHLSYNEAVEEALCWGWIDSVPRKLSDTQSQLYFSPRKKGSGWSKLNKTRIEKLIANGQMTPAGLAKIEAAKRDGSYQSLDAIEAGEIAPDFAAALDANPAARGFWDAFPPSTRRGIAQWIEGAKRPETRQVRIRETVELAAQNQRANQFTKRLETEG